MNIGRANGILTTSPTSSVDFEMRLPDDSYGWFLSLETVDSGGCKLLIIYCPTRFISPPTVTFPLSRWYPAWIMQASTTDPARTS